jgi:hypothetical protein
MNCLSDDNPGDAFLDFFHKLVSLHVILIFLER